MRRREVTKANFEEVISEITAGSSLFDPEIEGQVDRILGEVTARGDAALVELTRQFDQVELRPDQFAVPEEELDAAVEHADPALREAAEVAHRNITEFGRNSLRWTWTAPNREGAEIGEKFDPYQRVGIYVPGGTAPLISTALMTVTLAEVAGCPEVVVCTPCGPDREIPPGLMFAVRMAGATEVYRIGGAQAVAAMARGTETIRPVDKIFGPGNAYVVAAKRRLFGYVAVDLLPGPSELLVLGDESMIPRWVAADVVAQAEHGSGHERLWVIGTDAGKLDEIQKELERQMSVLPRAGLAERALQNAWLMEVPSLELGIELTNRIAPEHCEVLSSDPRATAEGILNAGALFLGGYSPTALGDYVAGPSHVLPTGGAARSFSGLTADQFQRRTSLVKFDHASAAKAYPALQTLAELEGLNGHARSVGVRLEPGGERAG